MICETKFEEMILGGYYDERKYGLFLVDKCTQKNSAYFMAKIKLYCKIHS